MILPRPVIDAELGLLGWEFERGSAPLRLSQAAWQFFGRDAEAEGLRVDQTASLVHPADRHGLRRVLRRCLRSPDPVDTNVQMLRRDGHFVPVLWRIRARRSADGRLEGVVAVGLVAASEPSQPKHRLDLAAETAGLGLGSIDLSTGRVTWNARMWALIGREPQESVLSEQEWFDTVIHPADRDLVRRASTRMHGEASKPFVSEYRVVWPDGTVRHLATRIVTVGHHVHGVTFDVTDIHEARVALGEAHERALLASRGAGLGTWEYRFADHRTIWDAQMCALHGLDGPSHAGVQSGASAYVLPEDAPQVLLDVQRAIESRDVLSHVLRVRWPDGSVHCLAARARIVYDEADRPERLLGVAWDMTEAREAAHARELKERAQAANEAKSQFLAQISHELRTPLNAVVGFTQLMLADEPHGTSRGDMLRHVHEGGKHLVQLVNQLLDLSGLESGKLKLQLQPVSLDAALHEALTLVEPMAHDRGVVIDYRPLAGFAYADPLRLRQVLINLLSNAIKYNRAEGCVQVHGRRDDGFELLCVDDDGPGLTPEQQQRLFEPFNRLGAERRGIEGTGIGLMLVKRMVEEMGGSIGVHSAPGQGSSFQVRLPASDIEPSEVPSTLLVALDEPCGTAVGRVLYIEDDPVNTLLFEHLLRRRPQVQLRCESTGTAGIARARAERFDLVVTDMQLPDMDGLELLRRLRQAPDTAHLRCVVLSANAMSQDVQSAFDAGFLEYWTKPIDFDRLLRAIDALMAPRR